MRGIAAMGLLLLVGAAQADDGRMRTYLEDAEGRQRQLQRCMEMTVPAAAADQDCQAAREAARQAHRQRRRRLVHNRPGG